ncbi:MULTISPECIES: YdaS family helix-turn-helix protein [unclassified Pseudoalteromonas]|uniref:YdaS family helix-turn-helix protein n=1 Tax=unclassified Pseudoalteromonas TaxID=194690 RepID=UPI0004096C84|nr:MULTISPECIES: YdaS family helix-turn-helix protein [unclassified Pseudoalteromonas]
MSAVERAIEIIGGQTKAAKLLNTKQNIIWYWLNRHAQAPAKYITRISELTNGQVTVAELLADHVKTDKEDAA